MRNFLRLCLLPLFLTPSLIFANYCKDEFRNHFKNILLVIHYNHPFYGSVEFERDLYSSIFDHIVFYGDRGSHPDVHIVANDKGLLFSRTISDVLQRYPGYEGYLFLQDDCLLHFWNYLRFDKNKIWFCQNQPERFYLANPNPESWHWWFVFPNEGMPQVLSALPSLSGSERTQLANNFGENIIPGQMCDMFYLPGRFSSQAIRLFDIFHNVFCEIAVPTVLGCLDSRLSWETFNYYWRYGNDGDWVIHDYSSTYDWMHPLKFSISDHRNFAKAMFNRHFFSLCTESSTSDSIQEAQIN